MIRALRPFRMLTLGLLLTAISSGADLVAQESTDWRPRFRVYEHNGEMYMYGTLEAIDITSRPPTDRELRQGRRRLQKFTRLRYNVHRVYPYAQRVAEILEDVERQLAYIHGKEAQKEYIKTREEALFAQYEDDLRRMSRNQGKVLVKLIYRQTGESTYELIRDTKSGAAAFFWNGIGRLFGINLKDEFDNEEDMMIDIIVRELERGGYNIAYQTYDYRLTE